MRQLSAMLGLAALLGGCTAVVEDRVETRLADAGVPAGMAACMAEIWASELSVAQIKRIGEFASRVKAERATLTVPRLIDQVREWNDPQALGVVTSSAG